MARNNTEVVALISSAGTGFIYWTQRNRRSDKLKFRKYDPVVRKHVLFVEGKPKALKKNG
jgi:large subunit ribosomal protein L33